MAGKKDFSSVNTNPVYKTIQEATQEQLPGQLEIKQRKDRITYSEAEQASFTESGKTQGHKGTEKPRINLGLPGELYNYVKTMSRASGLTMTEFIALILAQHKAARESEYKQILERRNSL